jgi:cysteine desulfurase/selenocysteine lyase
VIDAERRYYEHDNANIHRGVHALSERATEQYEHARETVRAFINAKTVKEVIFTRNATEGINLVARAWGDANVRSGDEVLITAIEHHSNIVPWQQLCARAGATLRVAPIDDRGDLIMEDFARLITPRTKMIAAVHLERSARSAPSPRSSLARAAGSAVLIDGSQAAYRRWTSPR